MDWDDNNKLFVLLAALLLSPTFAGSVPYRKNVVAGNCWLKAKILFSLLSIVRQQPDLKVQKHKVGPRKGLPHH